MEFLTNLFGNLTSGIIRLGVAVGILAAVYFFILRPVLDTTNHAVDSANHAFEDSFKTSKEIEAEVNKTVEDANKQVQVEVDAPSTPPRSKATRLNCSTASSEPTATSTGSNAARTGTSGLVGLAPAEGRNR